MTYVSCSPYMVPVAWLAAAQAEIKEPRQQGEVQPKASRKLGEVQPKASRANTRKAVTVATRKKRRDAR
jgi:hypothetical protein